MTYSEPKGISTASNPPPVTELFHRVNSVIPDEQEVLTIDPTMAVSDALDLLEEHGFSQAAVVVAHPLYDRMSFTTWPPTSVNVRIIIVFTLR